MEFSRQLWLPKVKRVKRSRKKRKNPEPKPANYSPIKKFEILHKPFHLGFRGRVNKWLVFLEDNSNKYKKRLTYKQKRLINLYFYPQPPRNKWLIQRQVKKKLNFKLKGRLRDKFIDTLLIIWESSK